MNVSKLPFVNDAVVKDVTRVVNRYFRDEVRVVIMSGPSLKDMLVKSSLSKLRCPREIQRNKEKKGEERSRKTDGVQSMRCRAGG